MGKLFNAIKKNYDEMVEFQNKQEQNYLSETTYDNIYGNKKKLPYLNYFIDQIQNNKKYYFGNDEAYKTFMEQNKETFPGDSETIPQADYEKVTVSIDVKGVDYEKILNTLEEKIGAQKTNELLEKYKKFTPAEAKVDHPFEKLTTKIKNELDELNINELKINEYKEALDYANDELIIKTGTDETNALIDDINSVREKEAKSHVRQFAQEIGADSDKVESLKTAWNAVSFKADDPDQKEALFPFIKQKPVYNEEFKKKVLELDKLVTSKGLIPDGVVGESRYKEYGFTDYFLKANELKESLLAYNKLVESKDKIEALENISKRVQELKEVTKNYNDVLSFIKENFDTSKVSLNANLYSGRVQDSKANLENFMQNLPKRWDHENAAPGVVLSGFAQLKGAAKIAGVSIEEYMENPNKYFMLGAKNLSKELDEKYLLPKEDIDFNPIALGKRIAHIAVMDVYAYTNTLEGYKRANRGAEFLNNVSEFDENTNNNIIISGASTSLVHMYDHSSKTLFMGNDEPDMESIKNLFALGNDTDNLLMLSKNYFLDDGSLIDKKEAYNLKMNIMKDVNPLNETRRIMGVLKDYMAERVKLYVERRNDPTTDIDLEDHINPSTLFLGAKEYMRDYIYLNNINLLNYDKKQRQEVMDFLEDPVKTFVEKYENEPNLLRTNYQGKLLETFDTLYDGFKKTHDIFYKQTGDNFVKAFNDLNTQTNGRNAGKSINEILDANKGGYFERKFDSSSKEYKALISSLEAATDPKSVTYGDLSGVKVYAQKYVDHKLPEDGNFNKLSENEKRRVEFCHTLIGAVTQMNLNQKMEESKIKLAADNDVFQENVKKDTNLDEEIDVSIDDNNEIVNENAITQ